jgi:hypothetical protein
MRQQSLPVYLNNFMFGHMASLYTLGKCSSKSKAQTIFDRIVGSSAIDAFWW